MQDDNSKIHPIAFLSWTFSGAKLNYDVHDKELLAIYKAFHSWHHYLEGASSQIDIVTDHKNLEYFATTKLLFQRQACWSKYLSTFNMVIRFWPGCLGTKPDALTRRPDLYPSGGKGDYGKVNPYNLKPIFSSEQLSASLRATSLLPAILHGIIAMDLAQLNMEILSTLDTDPTVKFYLTDTDNLKYKNWSKDVQGYVYINKHIFVPESGPFRLHVLQYHHDHPVSGHFGINKTLALICRDYVWPNLCSSVTDYCRSCTTCSCSKSKCHKPYGLL